MKKGLGLAFAVVLLTGCVTSYEAQAKKYKTMYSQALREGNGAFVVKDGNFAEIQSQVNEQLYAFGYKRVMYASEDENFLVVVRNTEEPRNIEIQGPHTRRIILNYSETEDGRTRVQMVNGSQKLIVHNDVNREIQMISGSIKNE